MTTADRVAPAIDPKATPLRNGEWKVRCPVHGGSSQNLYLRDGDDRLLVHCFAGCRGDDVIQYLRSQHLLPSLKREAPQPPITEIREFIAAHENMLRRGIPTSTDAQRTYRTYQRLHYKPLTPGEVAEMHFYCLAYGSKVRSGEKPTPAEDRTFMAYRKIITEKGVPYEWV